MFVERRYFERYTKETVFYLKIDNKSFEAKMIDYSLGGIGIIVKGMPRVGKGDVIDIAIKSPDISISGQVAWISSHNSGLRIGIENIGQIGGYIKDFRFSDTLIGLQRSQKTGLLRVELDKIIKTIHIRKGDMVFSASNQDEDRLGNMLVRKGKITPQQYAYSVARMKKKNQRLGKVLVSLGYLMPQELWKVVIQQVEEIILSLFTLKDGWFVFKEMPLPTAEVITLKLSTGNLIYYGIKKINNIEHIINELPSLDNILYFSSDPLHLFQDIKLDASGKKIISCTDNKSSIQEVVSASQLDNSEALKTIHALLSVKIAVTKSKDSFSEIPKDTREEILKGKVDPEIKYMVEDLYQRYKKLSYYELLGIQDSASNPDIKNAYYKAAKKFHPDIHFSLEDISIKKKLNQIFSYIHEAYTTLSRPYKREKYDNSLGIKPVLTPSRLDEARARFEEGRIQLRQYNYRGAELLFRQAIYFSESIAEYNYYYGLSLVKQKKFRAASHAIAKALKHNPFNADYMAELGIIYLELGLQKRAKGLFGKALEIDPEHILASKGVAKILKN
ncbi:MAG TPA: DUF4388 domain-containing protein [Nitrospirae bacterium]|nr:chaperone protein DnaJ [bacterium BMS3Abin10]GBE39075.1 chaperone protein DnaJ [bacterium BMS3Bbin08]HDH00974.1 DUF4388 domain-containing protein [Nitrospirota bacterium]HDH51287.1 DUF4388 domain-containing protein [Nitrospirota bacterium]HDO25089.1 DUF4388 domain-containing protein [Nitrospirota bacterium]